MESNHSTSPKHNKNTKKKDAMDVDGAKKQKGSSSEEDEEGEEGGAIPLPASAGEVPPARDEEAMDNLLTEARVRIRTVRVCGGVCGRVWLGCREDDGRTRAFVGAWACLVRV